MTLSIYKKSLNSQFADSIFHDAIFFKTALGKIDELVHMPKPFPESFAQYQFTIDHLNKFISVISSSSLKLLQNDGEKLRELFFRTLTPFDYGRGAIIRQSPLESILAPEINDGQQDSIDPVSNREVRKTLLEAIFANRLGVKTERAHSNYHIVFYILDRNKQRIGVFKPKVVQPPEEDNYGGAEEREAHLSEAASSEIDLLLDSRLVPHTCIMKFPTIDKYEGSFQFYLSDAPAFEVFLDGTDDELFNPNLAAVTQWLNTEKHRNLNLPNFEIFALFDLIKANNDQHFRNILRKPTGEMISIDNGYSFPWCHEQEIPSYKTHPLHWYKWAALPHAQKPFSRPLVDKINQLDVAAMEKILRKTLVSEDTPSSREHLEGKVRTLQDRIALIRQLANNGSTIAEIALSILGL